MSRQASQIYHGYKRILDVPQNQVVSCISIGFRGEEKAGVTNLGESLAYRWYLNPIGLDKIIY